METLNQQVNVEVSTTSVEKAEFFKQNFHPAVTLWEGRRLETLRRLLMTEIRRQKFTQGNKISLMQRMNDGVLEKQHEDLTANFVSDLETLTACGSNFTKVHDLINKEILGRFGIKPRVALKLKILILEADDKRQKSGGAGGVNTQSVISIPVISQCTTQGIDAPGFKKLPSYVISIFEEIWSDDFIDR